MKGSTSLKECKRLMRFSIVGVINTTVDFTIFIFLNKCIGLYYLFGQIASCTGGIINSFIFNKSWTFYNKNSSRITPQQLAQFVIVNIVSLTATLIGMKILVSSLNISVIISKVMVTVLSQIINYLGYKFMVFK